MNLVYDIGVEVITYCYFEFIVLNYCYKAKLRTLKFIMRRNSQGCLRNDPESGCLQKTTQQCM
jgi:hypothetical protein